MGAVAALLLRAEGSGTTVAGAVDPHADLLVLALAGGNVTDGPVLGLDIETILLEEGLSTLGGRNNGGRRAGGRLLSLGVGPKMLPSVY